MRRRFKAGLALAMGLALAVTGCTSGSEGNSGTTAGTQATGDVTNESVSENASTVDDAASEEQTGEAGTTGLHKSKNGIDTMDDGVVRKDLTALELTYLMGNGINLGNTFEAYSHKNYLITGDCSNAETGWGQPVTTQAMIDLMHDAGFGTIRIPVAWTNAMNYESGDYTIDEVYLDRVETVMNYALNDGMYVIINDHWDGSWWGMFGSATEETREQAMDMYTSMWKQLAERYAEYSDHLIFEGANEELGDRLNDKDVAKDSGSLSQDECYEMITTISQAFVDTVRATGGNNENRFLLIPGYNTDIGMTCDSRYKMPTDTADSKLLLSVHYYTPWDFCGTDAIELWGNLKEVLQMNDLFAKMTKYTDQGYGIIIGEYAALFKKDNTMKESTYDFTKNVLDNCDALNFVPVLWDCSNLMQRKTLSYYSEEMTDLFKEYSFNARGDIGLEEDMKQGNARLEETVKKAEETAASIGITNDPDAVVAYLMYNSGDYSVAYSVGNKYTPSSATNGVVPTDVFVDGEGTYTIGLDFTGCSGGYASGMAFSAIGIANAESAFPGYVIDIKEVLVNGEPYSLTARPYTSSDGEDCTRVNLFNEWVSNVPDDARYIGGTTSGLSACIVDPADLDHMESIMITFDFKPGK